jgi:hypothetical protein
MDPLVCTWLVCLSWSERAREAVPRADIRGENSRQLGTEAVSNGVAIDGANVGERSVVNYGRLSKVWAREDANGCCDDLH